LNDLGVIPGKLAVASATESRKIKSFWIPAFAGMTVESPGEKSRLVPGFFSHKQALLYKRIGGATSV
jgi:hypothetical protein